MMKRTFGFRPPAPPLFEITDWHLLSTRLAGDSPPFHPIPPFPRGKTAPPGHAAARRWRAGAPEIRASRAGLAVHGAVADGLGHMVRLNVLLGAEVGYGAGDAQHAIVSTGRQPQLRHRLGQQRARGVVDPAVLERLPVAQLGVEGEIPFRKAPS